MRRSFLAAGLALMATVLAVALRTTTSHAVPPPVYFGSWVSATPPVAGRTFTSVLVGHRPSDISWTLSCSVSVRDRSIAAYTQHFHQRPSAFETRSCSVYVPRGTAGSTLTVTVSASDSDAHTLDDTRGWRVLSNASMKTVPLGAPQPVVTLTKSFSDTPPVAGRAFMAAFVAQGTGGPWNFRCSATLHGRPVVVHRQEFGDGGVPDIRTCDLYVPRQTAGTLLGVTVDATTPNGQTLHATRGWHILGHR